jgi:hypothetical protein
LPYSHQLIGTAGKLRGRLPFTHIASELLAACLPAVLLLPLLSDLLFRCLAPEGRGCKGAISHARLCSKVTCTDQMDGNIISKHPRATWTAAPPRSVPSTPFIYTSPGTSHNRPCPVALICDLPHAHEGRRRCRTACLFNIALGSPSFLSLEPVAGFPSHLAEAVILYTLLGRVKHNIAPAP